jgi:hypothetical protein
MVRRRRTPHQTPGASGAPPGGACSGDDGAPGSRPGGREAEAVSPPRAVTQNRRMHFSRGSLQLGFCHGFFRAHGDNSLKAQRSIYLSWRKSSCSAHKVFEIYEELPLP